MVHELYHLVDSRQPGVVHYVGITSVGVRTRFKDHLRLAKYGDPKPLYQWLKLNFGYVTCLVASEWPDLQSLYDAEILEIKKLRQLGHPLKNLSSGGEGSLGAFWSAEQKRAVAQRRSSPEIRQKYLEAHKVRHLLRRKKPPSNFEAMGIEARELLSDSHFASKSKGQIFYRDGKSPRIKCISQLPYGGYRAQVQGSDGKTYSYAGMDIQLVIRALHKLQQEWSWPLSPIPDYYKEQVTCTSI